MRRVVTALIGVALLAGAGWVAFARQAASEPVFIEAKPDPNSGVPATDRPGFIRANESCEEFPVDEFLPGPDPVGFTSEVALDGLHSPTIVEFIDSQTAFIGLREGKVLRWELAEGATFEVIDLTAVTSTENDQGLTGLEVTPDGEMLLVQYTTDNSSRIDAYPLRSGIPEPDRALPILEVEQPSSQHNGGTLLFDTEGNLWTSFGDGGSQGDKWMNGQDPTTPLGSILRIELNLEGGPTAIGAADNPYADESEGHPFVFAIGIRNPFRMSIDPATGHLWVADVGQACSEEISEIDPGTDAGANLGWPVYEGRRQFVGELDGTHHEPTFSILRRGGWCAIVGGLVYRGREIPGLDGQYLFTDFCKGEIAVLDPSTNEAWLSGIEMSVPTSIVSDPEGTPYVTSMSGEIHRLIPAG